MNSIVLVGNVGKELFRISDNLQGFTICVNKQKKNADGSYETVSSQWYNCNMTNKIAEEYGYLIKKGAVIGVVGENTYNESNGKIYHNVFTQKIIHKDLLKEFRSSYYELLRIIPTKKEVIGGYEEPPKRHRYADDEVPF